MEEIEGGGTDEVHFAMKVQPGDRRSGATAFGCVLTVLWWQWEGAKKQSTLNVVVAPAQGLAEEYTADDAGQWLPMVAFDCRGLEPCKWYPQKNFVGEGTTGTLFDDIDFAEGDYCGFDEDAGVPTEISELEWKFEVLPESGKKGKKKK